jgi:hypothetical protein
MNINSIIAFHNFTIRSRVQCKEKGFICVKRNHTLFDVCNDLFIKLRLLNVKAM